MKASEISIKSTNMNNSNNAQSRSDKTQKPSFTPAQDDTKPILQDPILRSDPIETEEAVLRFPPFPITSRTNPSPK